MNLGVELINGRDIVVTSANGLSITYRKDGEAPMLFAIEGIGRTERPDEVNFWAQAWKAAHKEARALGWLYS